MKNLQQKLKRYSSASVAFLGAAIASEANVIYTDITDFNGTSSDMFNIDLDNNGTTDFRVYGSSSSNHLYLKNFNASASVLGGMASGIFFAPYALSTGAPIDASAVNWLDGVYYTSSGATSLRAMSLNYGSGSVGYWQNVSDKYIGVRFPISGNIHYGWIRMSVGSNASSWVIKDFAYEDCPNVGLGAGQTSGGCGTSCIPPVNMFDVMGCDSVTVFSQTFYTNQIVRDTLFGVAASGCDSVLEANIIIYNPNYTTDTISACGAYTWINGITYTESNDSAQYVLTNSNGCDSVVTLQLDITSIDNTVTATQNTLEANQDGATYRWLDCDNGMNAVGVVTQTYTVTSDGSYAVEITQNDCVDTSACVAVQYNGFINRKTNIFSILPNPASQQAIIQFSNNQNALKQIVIYNNRGMEVLNTYTSESQLLLTNLPPAGVYQVVVKSSTGVQFLKLVIL